MPELRKENTQSGGSRSGYIPVVRRWDNEDDANLMLRLCDAEELERKPQNPALVANENSSGSKDSYLLRELQSQVA